MRRITAISAFLVVLSCVASLPAEADNHSRYQEITIPVPEDGDLSFLQAIPDLELMGFDDGTIRLLSRPALTQELLDLGYRVAIRYDDVEDHLANTLQLGDNFGQFYTYSEAVDFLDSLHAAFPSITTEKDSIGTTWEGRTIWSMKVSDNPTVDEAEPEVLFDAVHHAREIITVSVLNNFMRWLCSSYGTDPQATFLVDNREIHFVPVVNPDGFVYNETTNPSGGGMWRKNRRDNPSTCEGVDLNRNYANHFGGSGASPNECDDTYHGPSAWSEPETQAMRDFIVGHEIVTHNSYHSVVGTVLYPWGWTETPSPDHATYQALGDEMTKLNGYGHGNAGAELYVASGVAFDWAYGDTLSKPKIFSFTTEVTGSGFWPQESEIPGLLADCLWPDIYLSLVAGSYPAVTGTAITGGNGDGALDAGETVSLALTIENQSVLADAVSVSAVLSSNDPYVHIADANGSFGNITAGASSDNGGDPFSLVVDGSAPEGHDALFSVSISWDGGLQSTEALTLRVGELTTIVADDFEGGNNGWSQDPSHTASTGDWVLIDPNGTASQPGNDATPDPGVTAWITGQNSSIGNEDVDGGVSALRSPTWDVTGVPNLILSLAWFHGQRDAGDDTGDFYRIDLSNDGGATWPVNLVSIGDVSYGASWQTLEIDLDSAITPTNQLALRVQAADGSSTGDIIEGGLDDLVIADAGSGNNAPAAPALDSPGDGSGGQSPSLTLSVTNAVDPDADPLTYGYRVYDDALLTNIVASTGGVAEGAGTTGWQVSPPLASGTYYWRAFAEDAEVRGPFMPAASFAVDVNTGVVDAATSRSIAFAPASPNPFVQGTTIRFTQPTQGQVIADVFDISGRHVKNVYRGLMPAGANVVRWDGRGGDGAPAATGLYFLHVRAAGTNRTFKVTLVK